ncbi:MAG: HD domain-containing protein [Ignavibacteria bacterium]|nr:HD domain-containing protein [Ignavibacteria bacterium]
MAKKFLYDIAVSYSHKDSKYVLAVVNYLKKNKLSVYIDEDVNALGDFLPNKLTKIYKKDAEYILMFNSKSYLKRPYTVHESNIFINRKIQEKKDIVLPILLDKAQLRDELDGIGYVDANNKLPKTVANEIIDKLKIEKLKDKKLKVRMNNKKINSQIELHSFIIETYLKKHLKSLSGLDKSSIESILKNYSKLFSFFIYQSKESKFNTKENDENFFDNLINFILKSSSEEPILISGFPGCGKSDLLSLLYLFLYHSIDKDKYIPILINLHYYNSHQYIIEENKSFDEKAIKLLNNDIEDLLNIVNQHSSKTPIFIIDGGDEFTFSKIELENLYDIIYSRLSKINNSKKFLGARKYKGYKLVGLSSEKRAFPQYQPKIHLKIKKLNIDNEKIKKVLHIFSLICSILDSNNNRKIIHQHFEMLIKKFGIEEIDFFHLNFLYLTFKKHYSYENCKNLSQAYKIFLSSNNYDIKIASEIAYLIYNKKEEAITSTMKNSREWWIINKHSSILDFLVANLVIDKLFNLDSGDKDTFEFIYPYALNIFCKELLNATPEKQQKIFNNIESLIKDLNNRSKTHLCYLLGRFSDINVKGKAKILLNKQKEDLKNEIKNILNDSNIDLSDIDKENLLYLRTIYISLIYLGDSKNSEEYIQQLTCNKNFDNLNRGFHLEYYGDIELNRNGNSRLKSDDTLESFDKTFFRLHKKLKTSLTSNTMYNLFQVELYTLCSLVQHRFVNKHLALEKKEEILSLITTVVKNKISISNVLTKYITFIKEVLGKNNFRKGELIKELMKIKEVSRSGWVKRGVRDYETVATHIYGAYLIGLIFLPDKKLDDPDYDKNKILKIILIHDLAEAYTGDYLPEEKNLKTKEEEERIFQYISFMSTFEEIANLREIPELYDSIEHKKGVNGEIAHDLDKLDNLMQLHIYRDQIESLKFNQFELTLINQIETDEGKKIKDIILNLFK